MLWVAGKVVGVGWRGRDRSSAGCAVGGEGVSIGAASRGGDNGVKVMSSRDEEV